MKKYIVSLDQGTTSSRVVVFDKNQNIVDIAQREYTQHYPRPGYVEHDPAEIFASQHGVLSEVISRNKINPTEIAAIGITNQRETTIVWDKNTGVPVYNAIVWQCRRTASICDELMERGLADYIKDTTGLVVDAYFSGTKIKWILDNVFGARLRAERGELLFGTVDTWLLWKLTDGKVHATDVTNASRTMLFDINNLCWDERMLKELDIPRSMLPEVRGCSEIFGETIIDGAMVPIAGIAGDQHAALFGQRCFERGDIKNTYGTGCFMLLNTGDKPLMSESGLLTTIGYKIGDEICYALEGSVFVGGAVIQWLRDELRIIDESADVEYYSNKVSDSGGVYLVPAFTGLGAPHWDMYARGAIVGITRGTKRAHIIRAANESIAYQSNDLFAAMERDLGDKLREVRVDGGACRDSFLMQFQSDISNVMLSVPKVRETTALGAAYLAGLAVGFFESKESLKTGAEIDKVYYPSLEREKVASLIAGWDKAVGRSKDWEDK